MGAQSVSIRPGVRILSVLRHLNYKPWYALAEFVDNSIQSFLDNRKEIKQTDGVTTLRVEIELDTNDAGRLVIRDNAAGINQKNYARAFRPAEVPPDQTGLSEFGMGMKSAACWFSPNWSVRTSALGESVEKTVVFNISKIVEDNLEELEVHPRPASKETHFTEVVLADLYQPPQGKTIGKIKTHLASIYRVFIREGILQLYYNRELLEYLEPAVLSAPFYTNPYSEIRVWRKEINFDFGNGLGVSGFAALREEGSTSEAGFALFRRNRLIQGSVDETYRPESVFRKPNSYIYQRLFGELHLEGFEVSHTKDGFKWDENETPFLDLLEMHLNAEPLPLLKQAEGHRVRQKTKHLRSGAENSAQHVARTIQEHIGPVIEKQITSPPEVNDPPYETLPDSQDLVAHKNIKIEVLENDWEIDVELSNDPAVGDWVSFSEQGRSKDNIRRVCIRLSLAHPFMLQFGGMDVDQIEPLLRVAVAIVVAQITAREAGVRLTDTFRRNINEILRDALSKP